MPSDPTETADHAQCSICSGLAPVESASQKWGWEQYDTHLPAAVGELTLIKDLVPPSSRALSLLQCPKCGTYYLYRSDYTYLANGSEDEQTVTRLSDEEAAAYR